MSGSPSAAVGTPTVQVEAVELAPRGERLQAHLERPAVGDQELGFSLPVSGWALAPEGGKVAVEIAHGRQVLRRLPRGVGRPDIGRAFPAVAGADRSGFSLLLDALKLPCAFELQVSGIVEGEHTEPIARVRGGRQPFAPLPLNDPAHPAPLLLTTLGRSGSTLLMSLLGEHPQVLAYRPATDDSRPFAYQLDAAIAMAAPASRMRLLDSAVQGEAWWLGRRAIRYEELRQLDEPLRELLLGAPVEQLLRSALDQAASFAGGLAAAQERPDARYAAEKCGPGYLPRLLRELCADSREIFLVRDFRDVLASMLAFNEKRGYAAFGREHVDSDERFVQWQAVIAATLAAGWRERGDGALLVRYEDLVADVPGSLARLLDYLELDAAPRLVRKLADRAHARLDRIQHRTTKSASASSGRWRKDLPAPLQELANEAFADPLREFGYA